MPADSLPISHFLLSYIAQPSTTLGPNLKTQSNIVVGITSPEGLSIDTHICKNNKQDKIKNELIWIQGIILMEL